MLRNSKKTLENVCEYCKRSFHDEINLINHSCEKKRRWFSQDEPHVRFGFISWSRFYELNGRLRKSGTKKSFKEFMDSKYYLAFVKFGKHMIDLNAIDPSAFIDYVIKNNLPLDKWTHDIVYDKYIAEFIRNETPEKALERNIVLMREWSQQTGEEWQDFFRKVSPTQVAAWVKNGKISPWVLYNSDSAADLLERCGPEQIKMITAAAKPAQWKIRFMKDSESADWVRTTLRQVGV